MACAYFNFRVRVVDGLGLEIPVMLAKRAAKSRDHAAELAAQKGVSLPTVIWGSKSKPKPPRHRRSPDSGAEVRAKGGYRQARD